MTPPTRHLEQFSPAQKTAEFYVGVIGPKLLLMLVGLEFHFCLLTVFSSHIIFAYFIHEVEIASVKSIPHCSEIGSLLIFDLWPSYT